MAKKQSKKQPTAKVEEAASSSTKKTGKNSKGSKNQKDEPQTTAKQPGKGRAIVAQTSSWTGKLPGSLLHEHCQKQKWGKVEYDMKKLPAGFIAVPQLSWENPKTKELVQIKFHPPKEIVTPQETPLEARHYAATYALHRIAFNKNLHMVLPTNHKNLWRDLDAERKRIAQDDPKRSKLEYANDPFAALLEKRKEDEDRRKEREVKQAALEKTKKQTIVIGATQKTAGTGGKQNKNGVSEPQEKKAPPKDGNDLNIKSVTFPRKVWNNSTLFDLDSELRVQIEDAIRNHIEWSETHHENHEVVLNDTSFSNILEKLGFRKTHVEECLNYTFTFNDALEWLIFHLPEDDLPPYFEKNDADSNVKLTIAKDHKVELSISQLVAGGIGRTDAIALLKHNNNDLIKSVVNFTHQFENKSYSFKQPDDSDPAETWLEEKNSLKIIYEDRIRDHSVSNDDIFEIVLNPEGLGPDIVSLRVYRSEFYPFDLCGMLLITCNSSYVLPSYIKKSIMSQLVGYLFEIEAFEVPYLFSCIDWLEHNIMKIIENPGPLFVPNEITKNTSNEKSSSRITKNLVNKQSTNKRKLDVKKIEENYTSRLSSNKYEDSLKKRAKLPAWQKRDDIIRTINDNKVCLITGETGSGKSTQIVQFILDDLNRKNDYHTTIICTQPRRISTIGLADRISDERVDIVGRETGYIIRGENKTTNETRITFVTTGVMLRMIQSVFGANESSQDTFFHNLGYIFIDEVHERSIDSDFLLIILKKMIKKFPKLRIVLMSATIDRKIFDDYFEDKAKKSIAHVHIEGRTFPIDDYYLGDVFDLTDFKISPAGSYSHYDDYDDEIVTNKVRPSTDSKYFQSGNINYDLIKELVYKVDEKLKAENDNGSILIFLPGVMEIKKCLNGINDHHFWKLPLHSALSSQEQKRIFENPPANKRKIIASTNIAETSITIPDAVVVIDTGRVKSVQYDSRSNNTKLVEIWVSKAEAKQRRGRAGRIRNGICYKLFTSDTEGKMIAQPVPEIKRTKLESVYLIVKSMGVKNVYEFLQNGLDPPHQDNVNNARRILTDVGALQTSEDELTYLGKYLSMLPTDLRSGKMMIFGCIFGCLDSCLTLAAIGVTGSPFTCKQEDRSEMKQVQQKFGKNHGDMIAILNAYNKFKSFKTMKERRNFCTENFLSMLRLNDIESTRLQYLNNLKEIGFVPFFYHSKKNQVDDDTSAKLNRNNSNINMVKSIITAALYPQIARVELPETKYAQISGGAIEVEPEFYKIKYWTRNERYRRLLESGETDGSENGIYPSTRVFMHPSSTLFEHNEKAANNSSFIVFNDSQETNKLYVHGITPTNIISILLFGGNISYDLGNGTLSNSSRGIVMDNWLPIRTWCKNAVLIGKLRILLDNIIQSRLENPRSDEGSDVLKVIEQLTSINM